MVGTVPRRVRVAARPVVARSSGISVFSRNSVWLFGVFALAMMVAFWPSYYSRLGSQPSPSVHAHGLAMSAWIGLLVAQAWLIRTGRRATHARVGKLSYVAAPMVVIATLHFAHFNLAVVPVLNAGALQFLALVFNALVAFVILYGLAMYFRKQPALHARYMIATLLPFFTPVTDRLSARYAPSLFSVVPAVNGAPFIHAVGFGLADVMLVALAIWDWRANRRADAFLVALGVLVMYHVSVMTFSRLPFWLAFGTWFQSLPLS